MRLAAAVSDRCVRHLLEKHRELEKTLDNLAVLPEDLPAGAAENSACESSVRITEALHRRAVCLLRKKDEVLFPALEAFLPADVGPLAVLRSEQAVLRTRLSDLRRAARSLANGKKEAPLWESFRRAGQAILQMLRDQIYKQERVLFPMVIRLLTPEQDARLLDQMEKMDRSCARGSGHRQRVG